MELAEILSNNEIVHASFALSWICLFLAGLLMFFTREEGRAGNTVLTLLLPVDILAGTAFAYIGSGTIDTAWSQIICTIILICSAAVIVCGLLWHSSTSVGLAAIGLEFAVISLRFFGGYTALIMSAYIVLIAFMHGLRKYRDHRERESVPLPSRAGGRRDRRGARGDGYYNHEGRQEISTRSGRLSDYSVRALPAVQTRSHNSYSRKEYPSFADRSVPAEEQPAWMDDFQDLRRPNHPKQQNRKNQFRPRQQGFIYEETGFSYDQEGFAYEQTSVRRNPSVQRNPSYYEDDNLYDGSDYYDDF